MSKHEDALVWNDYFLIQNSAPCGYIQKSGKRWQWWGRDEAGVFRGPASSLPAGDCATETEAKEACEGAALARS